MIIRIDDMEYHVTPEQEEKLLSHFHAMGVDMYEKQGLELQLLITAVVRWVLSKWEGAVRKARGKEAALLMRPPKKTEPAIHLSKLILAHMQVMIKNAELSITTDGNGTTTSFGLSLPTKGEGGGPLVPDGNIRLREDDGAQVS